jgi:hypothetical protein
MADAPATQSLSSADDESREYRSVEPLAIVALVLGLFSPLAIVASLWCVVPLFGLAAAGGALMRIARDERRGRAMALVGMVLAAFFLMVPLARYASSQWLLARQGRLAADQFVAFLHEQSPEKAMLLQMAPDFRPPIDDGLWSFYRNDAESRGQLRKFVANPSVRMLLALGDRADIQFYRTSGALAGHRMALVDYWYTVTFTDADNHKKTILFSVLLERKPTENKELNPWRVKDFSTDIDTSRTAA